MACDRAECIAGDVWRSLANTMILTAGKRQKTIPYDIYTDPSAETTDFIFSDDRTDDAANTTRNASITLC